MLQTLRHSRESALVSGILGESICTADRACVSGQKSCCQTTISEVCRALPPYRFQRLLKPLDRRLVKRLVDAHKGDRGVGNGDNAWTCSRHLTTLLFAQFAGLQSLREIEQALAAKPARSISALVSVQTLAKYVGDPRMIPSASSIFSMHSLNTSFVTAQR